MKKDHRTLRFDIRDPEQVRIYKEGKAAIEAWGTKGYELDIPAIAQLNEKSNAHQAAVIGFLRGRNEELGEKHPHGCRCDTCVELYKLHAHPPKSFIKQIKEYVRAL